MAIQPNYPITNAGTYYVIGAQMSPGTTTSLLNIAAGQCRDSTNINDIKVTAPVIVSIAVNGANGLDSGVIAANTFYSVYVIGNSTANDPSVVTDASGGGFFQAAQGLLSLSSTAPALPTGYDMFRRIGYILTSAGSVILKFDQVGNNSQRWMYYDAPIVCLAATAQAAFTALNINVTNNSVPSIATNVLFEANLLPNAAGEFVALQPASSTNATGYYARMSGSVGGVHKFGDLITPCSIVGGNPTINYVTDAASTVALNVVGYLDQL